MCIGGRKDRKKLTVSVSKEEPVNFHIPSMIRGVNPIHVRLRCRVASERAREPVVALSLYMVTQVNSVHPCIDN